MTAPTRPAAAAVVDQFAVDPSLPGRFVTGHLFTGPTGSPPIAAATWRRCAEIRREWLGWGLGTDPADRPAAEDQLTRIYARIGRPRPEFRWVDSPAAAASHTGGLPTHETLRRWIGHRPPPGRPPLASDLAAALSRLRSALDGALLPAPFDRPRPKKKAEPAGAGRQPERVPATMPSEEALRLGIPFRDVVRQGLLESLEASLLTGLVRRLRASLGDTGEQPVCWYGQQEAYWIARYDAFGQLGLARYGSADSRHLDDWAGLARSCGWWWPGEQVCVIAERPVLIRVEPVPGAVHGQVRLVHDGLPAVRYRDGWQL